jgi:L-alanine-DL-glutamate epimerase-like enolase superfamily enzyme
LNISHLAEAYNVPICPHFLMELHVSFVCAVQNAPWLEYIPQLDHIAPEGLVVRNGMASPSDEPGIGINWDWTLINAHAFGKPIVISEGMR